MHKIAFGCVSHKLSKKQMDIMSTFGCCPQGTLLRIGNPIIQIQNIYAVRSTFGLQHFQQGTLNMSNTPEAQSLWEC